MNSVVVIGAKGFVGSVYANYLRAKGVPVLPYLRTSGQGLDSLDQLLAGNQVDQVICTPQLNIASTGFILERIDGPRWVVLSSAQLDSAVPSPNDATARLHESLAIDRGARVLRPTMIFGHGKDKNISWTSARIKRFRVAISPGGDQLIQPLHVDDLCNLMDILRTAPAGGPGWDTPMPVGGESALTVGELLDDLIALVGRRTLRVSVGKGQASAVGRVLGLRPDQVARLFSDKVVDISELMSRTGWIPVSTEIRLEQAVAELAI